MMDNKNISVIVLTHNSYTDKEGSIELVLNAYLNQQILPDELIVVDNGSNYEDATKLHNFCISHPLVQLISCDLSIGAARNYGAQAAKSNFLLFNDDDTIPAQNDIIVKLQRCYKNNSYGYGANRLWTPDLKWVKEHKLMLKEITLNGRLAKLKEFSGIPAPEIRMKNENSLKMLLKSFIGNFGYIRRQDFLSLGGFPDFPGYACEDDALSFLCYLNFGRPIIFNDIELIHINHPLTSKSCSEIAANEHRLQKLLHQYGCSEFHVGRLLFESDKYIIK